MNATDPVQFLISAVTPCLPTLGVCILAGVVIATKWKQAPQAAMWAAFGFGLAFLLCLGAPLGLWLIQHGILENGAAATAWAFTIFGFATALLHAGVYVLLLVAVFAGRK
jgi:hypothetical protein